MSEVIRSSMSSIPEENWDRIKWDDETEIIENELSEMVEQQIVNEKNN